MNDQQESGYSARLAGCLSRRAFLKLSLAALWAGLVRPVEAGAAAANPPVLWCGSPGRPQLALTFDDCYHLHWLQALEVLLQAFPEIRVTFFPVGVALQSTAEQDPELWARLAAAGHEIGFHGFAHTDPLELTTAQAVADYDRWYQLLTELLGHPPQVRFARPPYGRRSNSFLNLCEQRDLVLAMWSTNWGFELETAKNVMRNVQNGDIVLLHVRQLDLQVMEYALPFVLEHGYQAVTLSDLYAAAPQPGAAPGQTTRNHLTAWRGTTRPR